MAHTKHRIQIVLFLALIAAGAFLLGACGPLEFGVEPTPTLPTTQAPVTVLVTREVTAPPAPTATPTVRATRPRQRPPSPTRTSIPTLTPMPTHTPSPTVCAQARVSGRVCTAGQQVTLSSCCPEWAAHTNADTQGRFEFAALTAGTFTVSGGGRSRTVVLETCESAVTVDLCPPPPTPGPTCPPEPIQITITRVDVNDYQVTINGQVPYSCAPPRLEWSWGDGWTDAQSFPARHTYARGGTYPVLLTVTNDTGQTATWTTSVYVGAYVGPMVLVPAGSFPMGCDLTNPAEVCDADAQPVHSVYLDAYYIDLYEVTNGRYRACVNAGGCSTPSPWGSATRSWYYGNNAYDAYPVLNVSWQDAADYCAWAGKRLPTEAEWEKAARGTGGGWAYPWGNEAPSCALANFKGASGPCVGDTSQVGHPAGSSPYGLQDMAGNVWEWVSDWYGEGYYSASPSSNPTGPAEGTEKVVRGGSWYEEARWVHASVRVSDLPAARYDRLGFRCARSAGN
jgi:formylglycine-generating enzyme required for sulfatase activity